ncbi:MAG: 2-C-methyl-D-erythritol 4-phosphate cytidylyltransferase [Ruminococcaceae bacterium]|nr:2-C-methyl-D-erythritol 4-phosphate cytidylyltransferase [Oscillospiraceae bacterium]
MAFFKKVRNARRRFCTAIVAAAGSSTRMGAGANKLLEPLGGNPVLAWTLQALDQSTAVDSIVIASREEDILTFSELCRTYEIRKPVKVVRGGANRTESVLLAALEADSRTELLAVQDGARPLVTPELIDRVIMKADRYNAAVPVIPVKDTVKVVQDDHITSTPDRNTLRAVQTPQVFEATLLKAALQAALDADAPQTDDAAAVERLGKVVYFVEGEESNIKITTPIDRIVAEAILAERGF